MIGEDKQYLALNLSEEDLRKAKRRCRTVSLQFLNDHSHRADQSTCDELYEEELHDPFEKIDNYLNISRDAIFRNGSLGSEGEGNCVKASAQPVAQVCQLAQFTHW